jgi:hypothetical protein
MKNIFNRFFMFFYFSVVVFTAFAASAQTTNSLPGRTLIKLLPDYLRPRVYALNAATTTSNGSLLALNPTNGATLNEISIGINPTDMAMSPAADALYIIHAGSRSIMKVSLDTFTVASEKTILTPNTYGTANALHLAVGSSNLVYFTDGAWAPSITTFDYANGTNVATFDDGNGAGGITTTHNGNILYRWRQYGWGAGNVNSWVTRYDTVTNNLTALEDSFTSWRRDPYDTPILLDAAETRVFNKAQLFTAANVSVLLQEFTENIYAISFDGSLAVGTTKVFNSANGIAFTNFAFSSTVETLSGDQKKLFRYNSSGSQLVVYDMAAIAPVSGPAIVPTPADGAVVSLPLTNLVWSVSPIALAYDVYFGTNQAQVATAGTGGAQYRGRVTGLNIPLMQPLLAGTNYFWRVDVVGFNTTNAGVVWSFTASPLAVSPQQVSIGAVGGFNPASTSIALTSSAPIVWTVAVTGSSWLTIAPTNGTSPASITLNFNTAALPAGVYTNGIEVKFGALKISVPVSVDIKAMNITRMATDYSRPYIYALQAPAASGQNGQLLFINTATGNLDKTLPIGINPTDLTIHYGEGRLYIASWSESSTYVVDLNTQTLLPPLHIGTDVYKINAGKPGRIFTEGYDQWIYANIVDTVGGTNITSMFLRQGDGETSPDGSTYYHSDDNISNANIHKYKLTNDVPTEVAGSLQHPYGSRNLVLSPDGTTLFWRGYVYDADLNEQGNLGEEIYATTAHGDLALGGAHAFNARNGQSLYTWPFATTVLAVSGDQQKVFLFNPTTLTLTNIPMSAIAVVPAAGLNPTPADNSVVNPPLTQVGWTASPAALSYRGFFGTNQAAVASATMNSPLYLGETLSTTFNLPTAVTPGVSYYWRVDSVGFSSVTAGAVWKFTVSPVSVSPQTLSFKGLVGLPLPAQSVTLTAPSATTWNLALAQLWITASATNGITDSTVTLSFNTTNLAAGYYTNQLSVTAGNTTLQLPVIIQLFDLVASKLVADPDRDCLYVLHPGSGSFDDAFLAFLNTSNGVVEKVIPIGANPTDMSINRSEKRLYISNWLRNQTRVVDLISRTELAPLSLGTDAYKINGGKNGRLIIEGQDQWITASLINTPNGATIATAGFRQGDGEFDPSGRYYYHSDDNISGAGITKFDMNADTFASVVGAGGHYYYGSRNIVMSLDGSRIFWTSAAYDAALNDLGVLGGEIYGCSTNGSLAFSSAQAYDTASKQVVFNLPVSSSVMAVDRLDQKLWYFNATAHRIENIPLATVRLPAITGQPAGATVAMGGSVYMTVTAIGVPMLGCQWTMAGTNLVGQTNFFLSLSGIQPSQEADYRVIVSNSYGSITSSIAHVTVLVPPSITNQPAATNILAGSTFNLTVGATGTAPLTYRWTLEGVNVSGATNSILTVSNAQASNEGIYRVVVANAAGSITSSVALVRILPSAPVILVNPVSLTIGASSNATFSVVAQGSSTLNYQWFLNNSPLAGATASQLALNNVQATNAGSYRVVISNAVGVATSASATLTVTPVLPYFVTQPVGLTLIAGTNFTLTSLARGSEPITYQWRRNMTNLLAVLQSSLTVSNAQPSDSGDYTVVASNLVGGTISVIATVTVTSAPPVFVQQPASTNIVAGANLLLNSLATGSAPLKYQWYFQSNSVPNQTNRQYTLNAISFAAAGNYFVTASNQFATATSSVAVVVVSASPVFLQGLSNLVVTVGSNLVLSVNSSGNAPLTNTWQFNGVTVATNGNSLTLSNIQPAQSGFYRVTVANAYGSVSSTGRVSVLGLPSHLISWGDNLGGQTNVPAGLMDAVAMAGGDYHTLILRSNGTLMAWGYNGDGQASVPTNVLRFVSVTAGANHNLAILENGQLVAWGRNDFNQRTIPSAASNNVLAVAAGDSHSLALLSAGTVTAWGDNTFGQTGGANGLTGIRAIAAGRIHSLALRTNGTVLGWGYNAYGQTTPPTNLSNVMAIAAGYLHSAALRTNGTVVVWGDNTYGQTNVPANVSNVVAIAAGDFHTLALRSDGMVIGWGDNSYLQSSVPANLSNVTAVASGYYHGLALVPTPFLSMRPLASGMIIEWSGPGVLQWATSLAGPFTDMPGNVQSFTNTDMTAPAKFFRLRR